MGLRVVTLCLCGFLFHTPDTLATYQLRRWPHAATNTARRAAHCQLGRELK